MNQVQRNDCGFVCFRLVMQTLHHSFDLNPKSTKVTAFRVTFERINQQVMHFSFHSSCTENSCETIVTPHSLPPHPQVYHTVCSLTPVFYGFYPPPLPLFTLSASFAPVSSPLLPPPSDLLRSSFARLFLTRVWCFDRRLSRALQQQREVRPGSERLALHLPVGVEGARLRRRDRNAVLRRQG